MILAYDNIWWAASAIPKFDTVKQIREWRNYNNGSIVLAGAVLAIVRYLGLDQIVSEEVAMLPILAMSLYDIKILINRYDERDSGVA